MRLRSQDSRKLLATAAVGCVVASAGCNLLVTEKRTFVRPTTASTADSSSMSSSSNGGSSSASGAGGAGGASCTDTLSDDANCGECGHACQAGHCANGTCQIIWLSGALQDSRYHKIVADPGPGGFVYVASYDTRSVYRHVKNDNSEPPQLIAQVTNAGNAKLFDLAVNDTAVYFSILNGDNPTPDQGFYSVKKDVTPSTPPEPPLLECGGGLWGPNLIRTHDSRVFVSTAFDKLGIGYFSTGQVAITPLLNFTGQLPLHQSPNGMVTDGTSLYFDGSSGGIQKMDVVPGANATPIYPNESGAVVAKRDDGTIYWLVQQQEIRRGRVDGQLPAQTVIPIDTYARGIVDAGRYLYVADGPNIKRVAVDMPQPGPVETVVTVKSDVVGAIATDGVSLFWLMFSDGRIFQQSL